MTALRCALVGHSWRFIASEVDRSSIRWVTWLCRRCPAKIETASTWDPAAGGILTPADLSLIVMLAGAALAVAWIGGQS